VIANLSRVMLAMGRLTIAAVAVAGSWLLVIVAQLILIQFVHATLVVGMLALGASLGQIGAAIPLVVITRRIRGKAAVEGAGRALLAGVTAAAAAGGAGVAVSLLLPRSHKLLDAGDAVVAALAAAAVFALVAFLLDRSDMRALVVRLRQALRHAALPGPIPDGAGEPDGAGRADGAGGVGGVSAADRADGTDDPHASSAGLVADPAGPAATRGRRPAGPQ
jgi:hypothetical protein